MLFDVKVGVNKDGYEVYRVEAPSHADAVQKARSAEYTGADEFEYVGEADTSCLTCNWSDVTEADVTPVPNPASDWNAKIVTIRYTNYRGETSDRRIVPDERGLRFAATEHHPEPQWVFDAYDTEKGQTRTFAMKDVHSWTAGEL